MVISKKNRFAPDFWGVQPPPPHPPGFNCPDVNHEKNKIYRIIDFPVPKARNANWVNCTNNKDGDKKYIAIVNFFY